MTVICDYIIILAFTPHWENVFFKQFFLHFLEQLLLGLICERFIVSLTVIAWHTFFATRTKSLLRDKSFLLRRFNYALVMFLRLHPIFCL